MTITHIPAAASPLIARLILAAQRTQSPAQLARLDRMIAAAVQLARAAG